MISINNRKFAVDEIKNQDIFICAMGYETRSFYLWENVSSNVLRENNYIFLFNDYNQYNAKTMAIVDGIQKNNLATIIKSNYEDGELVQTVIKSILCQKQHELEEVIIHIDYSSMPRSWYCTLPFFIQDVLREKDKVIFWYVAGTYPENYENSFDAGINSFKTLGYPSLRAEKRQHVLSLSYDKVRTQAVLSILDPDEFIVCNAYDPYHKNISNNVRKLNYNIVAQASMLISLHIDNFKFMVSKLTEVALEFLSVGDIVFVPDGPKPLIFAMSLIPYCMEKKGVTCLQITRNDLLYTPVNVEPTNTVFGVEFTIK